MRIRITPTGEPGLFAGTERERAQVLCDVCDEPITATRQGAALLTVAGQGDVLAPVHRDRDVRFVHKVTCDDPASPWQEAHLLLEHLAADLEPASERTTLVRDLPDEQNLPPQQ